MNRRIRSTGASALLVALGSAVFCFLPLIGMAAPQETLTGEITDQSLNCVETPIKAPPGITDQTGCALYWNRFSQPAQKFVLYDTARKTAYALDDQAWAGQFAGEDVRVTGDVDSATKAIKVKDIVAHPEYRDRELSRNKESGRQSETKPGV